MDKSNMRKVITDFPDQFAKALILSGKTGVKGKFNNVVICGLGGSALPANVLSCWIDQENISAPPIYIHRDYDLPHQAKKDSLVVCISYSGNTEETVSALNKAIKRKIKAIGISTGGEVEKICRKNNIPWVKVTSGIQPRSALGYQFTSLVKVLINSGVIKDVSKDISSLSKDLKKLDFEKEGKALAKKLVGEIPVVYASNSFKCAARIWKIKFNENSKVPAFYNYFPELNHNEMIGFTLAKKTGKYHTIILKDKNDHPRNLKRMKLFSEVVKEKGVKTDFVEIKGKNFLSKFFSVLLLGDWTTYHLALLYKVDPTPIDLVEEFKEKMK